MTTAKQRRTIMVDPDTHARLEIRGMKGDSFDDIVRKVIDDADEFKRVVKEYNELRSQVVGLCICKECDNKWFMDDLRALDPDIARCDECGAKGESIRMFGQ